MSLDERIKEHARAIAEERGVAMLGYLPVDAKASENAYLIAVLDFLEVAAGHGLTLENTASAEQFAAMVRGYILRDLPPELAAVLRPYLER